jgi:hypothetical protein
LSDWDDHGKYRGSPETQTIEMAPLLATKPILAQKPEATIETRLAHARALRFHEWDAEAAQQKHQEYESERLAKLYADEKLNPEEFCVRVESLPTDGVCTHCWAKGMLVPEELTYFTSISCMACGADYFLDVEPIRLSDTPQSARPGRHNETLPGSHHLDYDEDYRKNRKRTKKTDA